MTKVEVFQQVSFARSGSRPSFIQARGTGAWEPSQRKTVYLSAAVFGVSLLFLLTYLYIRWNDIPDRSTGREPQFGDFFALWSYAELAARQPVAELYDMALLHARQVALGMPSEFSNPFPYPPIAVFLFWPLRWLPYGVAYVVWSSVSLALFAAVVRGTCSRLPACLVFVLVSPAATGNIVMGQSGFVSAALLTAGIRLAETRPLTSGCLLGLLSYKPQLGLLVPLVLAAGGLWRTMLSACVTVLLLAAAATMAFGSDIWAAWLGMLPSYEALFDAAGASTIMPTVIANLQLSGASLSDARWAQAVVAVVVAVVVARCFRRDRGPLAAAAVLTGTFLATPHAFFYDLPVVTAAMVLFVQARIDTNRPFTTFEVLALLLAALFPVTMLMRQSLLPTSAPPLVLLFIVIVRAHAASARAYPTAPDPVRR